MENTTKERQKMTIKQKNRDSDTHHHNQGQNPVTRTRPQTSVEIFFRLKIPSVCVNTCFLKAQFVSRPCLCRVVVSWSLCRATHGLPSRALVYRRCPCRDPPVCHRVQGDSVFCVLVGVVTSCVLCARVSRVSRDVITTGCSSCATEEHRNREQDCSDYGADLALERNNVVIVRRADMHEHTNIHTRTHTHIKT